MTTLRVPKASAGQAWKDLTGGARSLAAGTTKLWLDGRRSFNLDQSVKQIGATEAWKQGMTGKGVTVAVLDSGYDPDHPDLKGVVAQERNFSEDPDIRDNVGHGTHVASIVAGPRREVPGRGARTRKLAIGKVGGRSGAADSAVLAGMEWAARRGQGQGRQHEPGRPRPAWTRPRGAGGEHAVGARRARCSSSPRGTTARDGYECPAPAAPTRPSRSARSTGRTGWPTSPAPAPAWATTRSSRTSPRRASTSSPRRPRAPPTAPMSRMSGTSMAAPHVAGAAAILAQRHPDWSGQQLKAALIGSAAPSAGATPLPAGHRAGGPGPRPEAAGRGPDGGQPVGRLPLGRSGRTQERPGPSPTPTPATPRSAST